MGTFVRTAAIVTVCLVSAAAPAAAGNREKVPLSVWKVEKGDSTAGAKGIVCRIYSPVKWDNVDKEVSEIRVKAEWLNPMGHVDSGLRLTVKYYDWSEDVLQAKIPRNTRHRELVFQPKWWKGRKVRWMRLGHGQSGVEIAVRGVEITTEKVAVFMDSSVLGDAKLHAGVNLRDNLIIMQWDAPANTRPYLTNVRAKKMTVVAAKSHGVPTLKNDLKVYLKDQRGNPIKVYSQPLDGNVKELTFSFDGVDMSKVQQVSFAPSGSGQHMHIRRIILGDASPPPPAGKCAGVKPLNAEFAKLLEQWTRKGTLGPDDLPAFMKLLQSYRALE